MNTHIASTHCRELQALRAEHDTLVADFEAHRRATSLLIEELRQDIERLSRQDRTRQDVRDAYSLNGFPPSRWVA